MRSCHFFSFRRPQLYTPPSLGPHSQKRRHVGGKEISNLKLRQSDERFRFMMETRRLQDGVFLVKRGSGRPSNSSAFGLNDFQRHKWHKCVWKETNLNKIGPSCDTQAAPRWKGLTPTSALGQVQQRLNILHGIQLSKTCAKRLISMNKIIIRLAGTSG